LNYLIDQVDLSAFDAAFHNDRLGAPAYPPDVMLKIIFYCYSRGIITSRPIAYACKTNIIVKALARDAEPDHDTIAHFISSRAEAVKELFAQVLLKCYGLGLIGGELFAIDGCKLPSNAAKEWSGTLEELGKKKQDLEALMEKIIGQHVQLDKQAAEETELSGAALWNISPSCAFRLVNAISIAGMVVCTVSRSPLKAQPMTFRSYKSRTTVRNTQPPPARR
jgi:transposase